MTRLRMAHPFPSCLFLHATDEMVSSAQPPQIVLMSWSMAMGICLHRLDMFICFPFRLVEADGDGVQFIHCGGRFDQ